MGRKALPEGLGEAPLSAASLWPPRLTSELSAWNEHIPLAGWIVEATKPDVLVELGTHSGVSYFAFCESVRRLDLGTRCFAVDTWLGDEHAGSYGEEIYESVETLNSEFYGSFSRLIRTTFDEALTEFEDASIDLLHIDGLHTYEAVLQDFEHWRPKLSSRAVVLLHDTNERKDDFGVYRLFTELSGRYPSFEFTHGHGLGVVAVGEDVPSGVKRLVQLGADSQGALEIRDLYAALGRRLSAELAEAQSSRALEEARRELGRVHDLLDARIEELGRMHGELGWVHSALKGKDDEIGRLAGRLVATEDRLDQLRVLVADADRRTDVVKADARVTADELEQIRAYAESLQTQTKKLEKDLTKTKRSYARLRNRRSVRLALGFAGLFQPLFKLVRRVRGGSQPAPDKPTAKRPASATRISIRPAGGQAPRWPTEIAPGSYTIIVPVFNAYEEVEHCLRSILRNTTGDARLLVIDDASTDERIPALLAEYATLDGVEILTNDENLGFTATVNRGFEATSTDVVVLNSDVEVPPGWLHGLHVAAHSGPRVGTVTALSDNAGAFSAPEFARRNPIPMAVTKDQLGRGIAQAADHRYPRTPTGNGFCMLIRRDCLDEVGLFDAEAFSRGYGEENDFSMRALRKGWLNLIDDTTFVLHASSASFGEGRHELMSSGEAVIDERYPEYRRLVADFVTSDEMVASRTDIGEVFAEMSSGENRPLPRVLFILHDGGGGTPATTADLTSGLKSRYEAFVLISDGDELRLEHRDGDDSEVLFRVRLGQPTRPDDLTHPEYRQILTGVLVEYAIDVVNVHHLIGHGIEAPAVSRSLGIPIVLSLHDFYYVCPTVHLMDNEDRFCGGTCTAGQGECPVPTPWLQGLPHLKHEWVYEWRNRSLRMFDNVDAFVAPSEDTKSHYLEVFPELASRRFEVIEHGRDEAITSPAIGVPPMPGAKVKILLPGHLDPHKGSRFVKRLTELDETKRLEFHVLGRVDPVLDGYVVDHGTYDREDFAELAKEIDPSFVGLFSTTAESYSFVLSESWSAGIPVLTSNLGALQERVRQHGGGWVVDIDDPAGTYQRILEIADDGPAYADQLAKTRTAAAALRSVEEMAFAYSALYGDLRQQRRTFPVEVDRDDAVLRIGAFMPDAVGGFTAASHVRLIRRLSDPGVAEQVAWTATEADRFLSTDPETAGFDVVVVQRNAIRSSLVDDFVATCRRADIGIVLDLDDDLLNDDPGWAERSHYEPFRHSIETLARAASVITVSTEPLAKRMAEYNGEVVVLPNALDQSLWFRDANSDLRTQGTPRRGRSAPRLVYVAGPHHLEDLEVIRPALELVRSSLGSDVELSVIGGVLPDQRVPWLRNVKIPKNRGLYPRFATWVGAQGSAFDIGLAPLAATPLNEHKSDLRLLEYGAMGLPGIYSRSEAFATVEDGVTGLVVDNTPEAWAEAILRLWQDDELRNGIRQRAMEYVATKRLMSQQSEEYLALLRSVRNRGEALTR